jgi:hypothetical protein
LAWISENLRVFWLAAHRGYEEHSRGATVADTTQRPTGESQSFGYLPKALAEQTADEDTQRMVREHDPGWDMVIVLLKTHDRTSKYRAEVVSRNYGDRAKIDPAGSKPCGFGHLITSVIH